MLYSWVSILYSINLFILYTLLSAFHSRCIFLSVQSWLCFLCPKTCFWRICIRGVSLSIFIVSPFGRFSSSQSSSSDEKSCRSLISYWIWITFSKYFSYFFLHICSLMISVKLGYLCGSGFNVKAAVCCGRLEHRRNRSFSHTQTYFCCCW